MAFMRAVLFFLARLFLSSLFLLAAAGLMTNWGESEQALSNALSIVSENTAHLAWLNPIFETMLSWTSFLMVLSVVFTGIGGLLVLLGIRVRFGATLLILFLIPCTAIMHHFWILNGIDRVTEMSHFMKNVSLLGGLFLLVLHPSLKKESTSLNDED